MHRLEGAEVSMASDQVILTPFPDVLESELKRMNMLPDVAVWS
jgi:hypothetical protein